MIEEDNGHETQNGVTELACGRVRLLCEFLCWANDKGTLRLDLRISSAALYRRTRRLFKKNQLDAQLIYMPGGSLIVQALLSGDVGVASLAPPSASVLGRKAPSLASSPAASSGR
jgi:hypothetical protein